MPSDDQKPRTGRSIHAVFRSLAPELGGARDATPARWKALARLVEREARLLALIGSCDPIMIGRFEAVRKRGAGGHGVVFEVRDPEFDRHVALKLCAASHPKAMAGLRAEAKILAKLSHPNVVRVYEPGRLGEDLFFVMELVSGIDGRDFARQQPPPRWEQAVDVYRQAGRGLAAAHAQKIVHGDFKPSNILLDEDERPRVSDFGLARVMREHDPDRRQPGGPAGLVGTLAFMPPEVLRFEQGDARSDQWSFCASLWLTVEGCLPFIGLGRAELLTSVLVGQPRVGQREVPEALRKALMIGLSPRREDRYDDMDALLARLDELREPPAQPLEPEPESERAAGGDAARRADRRAAWVVAGLLAGAFVLGALSYSQVPWPWSEAQVEPELSEVSGRGTPAGGSACLDEGAPFEPDPAVRGVCLTLRVEGYEGAQMLWDEMYLAREQGATSAQDWLELASNNAVVARTFLAEANMMGDEELYRKAISIALVAEADIARAREVEATNDFSLVASKIQSIIAEVVSEDEMP